MLRYSAAVVVALLVGTPTFAQLDPEPKQPYQWRVVLSVKSHPLLTPDFRDRLKRDVLAALQPGLGNLGAVEVIDLTDLARDKWEPLWEQFDSKGFAALDAPRDLSGAKTHFLKVEYRDGKIHAESRQYDGFTGLSSPLVRTQSTRAPELVGRTAGLMLDRDFGLVGTVEAIPGKTDEVKVLVRGAGLGSAKDFVQAGDIFTVAAVRKTNRAAPVVLRTATGKIIPPPPGSVPLPGLTSTPRDFTLLKVTDVGADGALRCAVLTRYEKAMPTTGGIVGYRAMKLGTVKAAVAVRLVGSDGTVYKTASAVNVRASDTGFVAGTVVDAKDVCKFHAPTAQFRTDGPLSNVACITVARELSKAKQFPVPILSSDPITLPYDTNPETERRADFERAVLKAASDAADARLAQSVCFEAVADLIKKQKNADALARAKGGFDAADAYGKSLTDEVVRLREEAKTVQKAEGLDAILNRTEQNLVVLKVSNEQLGKHRDLIEAVVKRENDPTFDAKELQAEEINERIKSLLARGDVDEALAAYDQLFALLPGDAVVKRRKDELAAEWKVKDDAHQKARDYLLKTWPAVATIQDFEESTTRVRDAVAVCKRHGDKLTLRKLLTVFSTAIVKLNDLVAPLDPASEADRKLFKAAETAGREMAKIEEDLRAFVK